MPPKGKRATVQHRANQKKSWTTDKRDRARQKALSVWTDERKEKISREWAGENSHNWKGGRIGSNGYVLVLSPGHPNCDRDGYVPEHRLVAEKALGKYLLGKHRIHHINGDKADNRNSNLVICESLGYHMAIHQRAKRLGISYEMFKG